MDFQRNDFSFQKMKLASTTRRDALGCFLLGLILTGCTSAPEKSSPALEPSSRIISARSVGEIQLGMTVAEARVALGNKAMVMDPPNQPFIVINAFHIVRDRTGKKLMELLVDDFRQPNIPGNPIVTIRAMDRSLVTGEGVYPGMTIAQAAVVYGAPTLRKSLEEGFGGEWVSFPRAPLGLRFSVRGPEGGQAGLYPPGLFQSERSVEGARIEAIEIGRPFLN